MKLLVTTQAVDLDDPVLGFFHRWIEELSKRYEHIEVICLKLGRHTLPPNVSVYSIGKEKGAPRFARRLVYSARFLKLAWRLRNKCDAVFVHMNEEYVMLFGVPWRLAGKRVVLWRNFKTGSWMTPVACKLAHKVCYTSPESFTRRFPNSIQMPIGIDTHFFKPAAQTPEQRTMLFLGRIDQVKRVDEFVAALKRLHGEKVRFFADIVGDPTDPKSTYALEVQNRAGAMALEGVVKMRPSVTNEAARDEFASHAIYANLTPSGSFDKTIGEAAACGCVLVIANNALRGILPQELFADPDDIDSIEHALRAALELPEEKRRAITTNLRAWVEREHSLSLLVDRMTGLFKSI